MVVKMNNGRMQDRIRTIRSGTIIFSDKRCSIPCIIKNLSENGAKLRTDNAFLCPNSFRLTFQNGPSFDCTVKWRNDNSLGIAFTDPNHDKTN